MPLPPFGIVQVISNSIIECLFILNSNEILHSKFDSTVDVVASKYAGCPGFESSLRANINVINICVCFALVCMYLKKSI